MPVSVDPGSPVLIFRTRGTRASRKSPLIAGWVMTRCTEMQTWPALTKPPRAIAAAAASMSASGSTTTGHDAPSSSESFLTPACSVMRVPVAVDPVKEILSTRGSRDQRVAQLAAGAGEHRQHALGQAGVDEARGERQRGQRCGARRLEHHGVPGRQGRRDLVQHQQRRVVERRDGHDDPDRLAHREADLVEARSGVRVQRQRVAVELGALERRQPDQLTGARRLAAGLGDGLAGLGADRLRDRLGSLVGQGGRPQQDLHPLVGGRAAPDPGPLGRRGERGVDVVEAGQGDRPDDRPVEGRGHVLATTRAASTHWPPISSFMLDPSIDIDVGPPGDSFAQPSFTLAQRDGPILTAVKAPGPIKNTSSRCGRQGGDRSTMG